MRKFSFINFLSKSEHVCDICPKARQTRLTFPISVIHSTKPFELIHIDTWGPYKPPTYNGFRYFLTIVDDYSRGTWTFLLISNSNVFPTHKEFLAMIERQFHAQVKFISSDNALQLGTSIQKTAFLKSQGILHQTSCVGTPQQKVL